MYALPTAVAFASAERGWLGTTNSIERTVDGGRTWRVVLRTSTRIVSLTFDSSGRPRAVLASGASLRGPQWRAVSPLEQRSPCPSAYDRPVFSRGWALCIGQGSAGAGEKSVYRLTRAGPKRLVWATTGVSHGIPLGGYAEGIAMARGGFGIIWESRGTLYVTRDGGMRWTGLPQVAEPDVDFGIAGSALPHGVAFVVLARHDVHRRLLETTDYGRTWRVVHRWG